MQKPTMTSIEVFEQYAAGRRDFSNIRIIECDLSGKNLEGIILKNSDLFISTFRESNLTNSDFSGAKMLWSDLSRSTMTNARFEGTDLEWSALNRAIFNKTSFRNANLSNTVIFDANRGAADFSGANLSGVWWSVSDITMEGIVEALEKLKSMGLPLYLFEEIKKALEAIEKKWEKHHGLDKKAHKIGNFYERLHKEESKFSPGEYGGGLGGVYSKQTEYGGRLAYGTVKKRMKTVLEKINEGW